jgi:3-hydroxybutyryl-CoA dehydrogenase
LTRAEFFKRNFLDKGKLGVKSGEGFYKYPDPAYRDPAFLK